MKTTKVIGASANPQLKDSVSKLKDLEAKAKLIDELPHLFGRKFYPFQREFLDSKQKITLLCSGNQIGKSIIGIIKCVTWATSPNLWKQLWKTRPNTFWYLYPDYDTVTTEFEEKWVKEILPKDEMKSHPTYGWQEIKESKKIKGIRFNSGVTVYFKTYGKDVMTLQATTVWAIFCDEELPVHLYPEVMARVSAVNVDGYFNMMFTATLGQEFWRLAIEPKEDENRNLPHAKAIQVSLYDALYYEDNTRSDWTRERIEKIKANCLTPNEILKRVYGRFIRDSGLKYPTFDREDLVVKKFDIGADWLHVGVVDSGSGGKDNHPAAIAFFAVRPDRKLAIAYKIWRGDGIVTISDDCYKMYKEMRGSKHMVMQVYDWGDADFGIIAERNQDSFVKAKKDHELGEGLLNQLFKSKQLLILDNEETQASKACAEFESLLKDTPKRKAKDDLVDTFRYFAATFPMEIIEDTSKPKKPVAENWQDLERKGIYPDDHPSLRLMADSDFDEWNTLMGEDYD